MKVIRVSELSVPEGTFYGVAILGDGECVLYQVEGAVNGSAAVDAVRDHAQNDGSLGVLADGSSPVRDVRLVI